MIERADVDDLRFLEDQLRGLSPEQIHALQQLPPISDGLKRRWRPNPGKQTLAYFCEADELFYGGGAGGGKSDLGMGLAICEHRNSLLLRRTNKEASKFIKRLSEIVGTREGWNGQLSTFSLPDNGILRIIETGGVQLEDDKQKYKGDPHDLIFFDEVGDFTETQYRFISAWNRSTVPGQRVRVLAAGNPPTNVEGLWVVKHWGAWLDPTHPRPAEEGDLRWYTQKDDDEIEVDGPGPHDVGEGRPVYARSRTFIRATLSDNPDLDESGYDSTLAALPAALRSAYRDGKFDVVLRDDAWQVIPTAWILAAQARWQPDGWRSLSMDGLGVDPAGGGADAATIAPRYGYWFGNLTEVKGPDTKDGSAMLGHVTRCRRNEASVIIDVGGGYAGNLIERLKDNGIAYTRFDGSTEPRGRAKGSNLKFANKRAEAYFRLMESLDPDQEGGSIIALPPDSELRADLASVRYETGRRGIILDDKDDIRVRLGRSPNKGDAVVMAHYDGLNPLKRRGRPATRTGRRPQAIVGYATQKSRTRQ